MRSYLFFMKCEEKRRKLGWEIEHLNLSLLQWRLVPIGGQSYLSSNISTGDLWSRAVQEW